MTGAHTHAGTLHGASPASCIALREMDGYTGVFLFFFVTIITISLAYIAQ